MRFFALPILMLLGCSNTYTYPVDLTRDGGTDQDSALSLMPFRDRDGGSATPENHNEDAGADDGGAVQMRDSGHGSNTLDASVMGVDSATAMLDTGTSTLGTMCSSCQSDNDCGTGYRCYYRTDDNGKVCIGHYSVGESAPPICVNGSTRGLQTFVTNNQQDYWCSPLDKHTCAAWLAQYGM
jgi:hypothetical protein